MNTPSASTRPTQGPATISTLLFALAVALPPQPGSATVYEYGPEGQVLVDGAPSAAVAERPTTAAGPAPVPVSRKLYRDLAEQVALRHAGADGPRRAGLDAPTFARLFVELIRAESAFDPDAVSRKGAQGLGQLMPATARALGVTDPFDPVQNLDGAARYFTTQLARFGGVHLALAAYNAGPHRVVEYGGVPPFRETRDYIAKIASAVGVTPTSEAAGVVPVAIPSPALKQRTSSVWQY